ncbi:MAG: HAD family hydrolase [Clostridiaceae bacterium]|nr:HAD family hydrolase [Clostridiaceae bacterium]
MKVIVTDLDGTLLRQDKNISDRTLKAMNEVVNRGFRIIVATARPKRAVRGIIPSKFLDYYLICYNGAEIYHGEQLIHSNYLKADAVKDTVRWFMENYPGIRISIEIMDRLYANFDVRLMTGWLPEYTYVDFNDFDFKPTAKILVDLCGIDDLSRIYGILPDDFKMVVTDSGTLGQIAHKDVSKMNAIRALSEILGFKCTDVIAFGDDYNDLDMIRECGMGIAMGNAPEEVKKAAKRVTDTNDNDGVAMELENITRQMKE